MNNSKSAPLPLSGVAVIRNKWRGLPTSSRGGRSARPAGSLGKQVDGPVAQPESNLGSVGMVCRPVRRHYERIRLYGVRK
jgi:hypothetical protein